MPMLPLKQGMQLILVLKTDSRQLYTIFKLLKKLPFVYTCKELHGANAEKAKQFLEE